MKRIWRWSVLPGAEGGRDGIGPRSGELRTEKLKSHLLRTQSLKVLPLKPGVGQYIAIHATLTTRDFFLANIYILVHSPAFFPKHLPSFGVRRTK